MANLFDQLILRIVFTLFICLIIYIYKYAHAYIYPSAKKQIFNKFYPSKNPADSLHFFSRILGIGIIFSGLHFDTSNGVMFALIDFLVMGVASFVFYLLSIYILESIILYNFDYSDEILKRKNICYGTISFSLAISLAIILKAIVFEASSSLVTLLFMWLFTIVIFGLTTKVYPNISKIPFNRSVIQKNISLAFSYSGFIMGLALIIASAFKHKASDIQSYSIMVILDLILSAIIFPLFQRGLILVFKLQHDVKKGDSAVEEYTVGHGLFEGVIFLTSCFLTSIITGQIHFGTFYPVF